MSNISKKKIKTISSQYAIREENKYQEIKNSYNYKSSVPAGIPLTIYMKTNTLKIPENIIPNQAHVYKRVFIHVYIYKNVCVCVCVVYTCVLEKFQFVCLTHVLPCIL